MKSTQLMILMLTVLALASRTEAAVIIAATASGSSGELYVLNPVTGAVIKDVGPLNDAAGANYPITGLAFHPTTKVLYGSTGNNSDSPGTFVSIDRKTGLVTVIGPFNAGPVSGSGKPATMTDLVFDSDGNLYGVGSIGGPQLYSIDITTGQATAIGNSGLSSTTGGGLAIGPDGTFYGTPTASRFGTYDSTTGVFTETVNPITRPGGGGAYAALALSPSGELYGLNSAPGTPPPAFLAIIDPATGTVTNVGGQLAITALDAIAFIPEPTTLALVFSVALLGITRRR